MQTLNAMLVRSGVAVILLSSATAIAHHSYTRFDMAKAVMLEGTVKEFQWTNPHVWIQLLVKDPATGRDVEWSIESDSPNMLARRGWTRKALQPGDKATMVVHPLKIASSTLSGALDSVLVNGKKIGEAVARPADGAGQ
jgi:hypothetical protein